MEVSELHLRRHLAHWGIDMLSMVKTEPTMHEINAEMIRSLARDSRPYLSHMCQLGPRLFTLQSWEMNGQTFLEPLHVLQGL